MISNLTIFLLATAATVLLVAAEVRPGDVRLSVVDNDKLAKVNVQHNDEVKLDLTEKDLDKKGKRLLSVTYFKPTVKGAKPEPPAKEDSRGGKKPPGKGQSPGGKKPPGKEQSPGEKKPKGSDAQGIRPPAATPPPPPPPPAPRSPNQTVPLVHVAVRPRGGSLEDRQASPVTAASLSVHTDASDWGAADRNCANRGSELVVPRDGSAKAAVKTLLGGVKEAWVGLQQVQGDDVFRDGKGVCYDNQGRKNCPVHFAPEGKCVVITASGVLTSRYCNQKLPYVCHILA